MRLILKLTASITLLLTIFSLPAHAQTAEKINVVTTAVPFLRISPDARSGGMGDLGIATLPDASASYFNLGKVPFNVSPAGVNLTYTPWLKKLVNDVYLASAAGYYKLDELQAVSASLRYFSLGNIQFTDAFGNNISQANPKEFGVDIGYSRRLSDFMGIGVGLKYIYSNLAGGQSVNGTSYKPGSAVAGDLGFYFTNRTETDQGWAFGATLTNLGSKISYTDNAEQKDYIPANLGIGTTYTRALDESNKISFGIDVNKLLVPTPPQTTGDFTTDSTRLAEYRSKSVVSSWFSSLGDAPGGFSEELKEFQISAGAEYWYNNQFAVRAGYFYENKIKGNRRFFTTGVGVKYNIFGLNFSYLVPAGSGNNQNPLSNTLRFSLVFDLNGESGGGEQ
ncbi:MAG: type IX secretion system outer membrane channel protein PorV [Chitinophagaceae bacterium]|nr:type IX secretion system outer membrane channel protein PorV [Chitinophagaceae bacterium]